VTGGEALSERQTHVLEIAAGTMEENNRRPIDYSGALAQFDDVLTQAADLEEAPAWWVRPLDQLRPDESDGGVAAKERSDNGESVHSSSIVPITGEFVAGAVPQRVRVNLKIPYPTPVLLRDSAEALCATGSTAAA
jgi:hypothetical protein